jgi:mRNA-degrading endonuclease YafQ of YafQ-DinJ toxin-antitoxin module
MDRKQSEMQKEIIALQQSAQFNSDVQEECSRNINKFNNMEKNVDKLEEEIKNLRLQNREMKLQVNLNEQRERQLNVEIMGVPELKNENLIDIVTKICKSIELDILINDIVRVNRVTPRIKLQGRPRVIIAKLSSTLLKDNMISLARKNHVNTNNIDMAGEPKAIFVNEHLTPYNKQMFKKCKEFAKNNQYKYVWTKNGKIYLRQNDTSPAVQISDEEDLKTKIRTPK